MKNLKTIALLGLVLFGGSSLTYAQTPLTATTLSAGIDSSQRTFKIASATGVTANATELFIDNEALPVVAISGTTVSVAPRGSAGTRAMGHISGAMVLAGPPQAFVGYDPSGSCTAGQGLFQYTPVVNINTGNQWLCGLLGKVVPGWGNGTDLPQPTAAVASAAGLITPSGPLFHITGALAITGFNIPVGFDPKGGAQSVCVIPDGAFTTTNANNIAIASTGVVSKTLCWTYDPNTSKFYPSY
jgi:hypothetical protein